MRPHLTVIAAVLALAGTAHAQTSWTFPKLNPPPEYDRPYTGQLLLTVVDDLEEIRTRCKNATFFACSFRHTYQCIVLIPNPRILSGYGLTTAKVMRHELAHCNGWPGDHPGGTDENGK